MTTPATRNAIFGVFLDTISASSADTTLRASRSGGARVHRRHLRALLSDSFPAKKDNPRSSRPAFGRVAPMVASVVFAACFATAGATRTLTDHSIAPRIGVGEDAIAAATTRSEPRALPISRNRPTRNNVAAATRPKPVVENEVKVQSTWGTSGAHAIKGDGPCVPDKVPDGQGGSTVSFAACDPDFHRYNKVPYFTEDEVTVDGPGSSGVGNLNAPLGISNLLHARAAAPGLARGDWETTPEGLRPFKIWFQQPKLAEPCAQKKIQISINNEQVDQEYQWYSLTQQLGFVKVSVFGNVLVRPVHPLITDPSR